MKNIKVLLVGLIVGMLCAGCGISGDTKTTLRLAVNDASTSLNFLQTILEPNVTIITNLQEGLVQYDAQGQLKPTSASSWDISPDQKTYTFTIREHARWSNGDDVSADDFVYSIHTRIQSDKAVYSEYYKDLLNGEDVLKGKRPITDLGVKALGRKQLEFTLTTPKPDFLDLLAFETFLPLNQKFYERVGAENYGSSTDTILANGAYTLASYDGAAGWTLAKNKNYWDATNVALESIDVRVVKETASAELMWDNKELDVLNVSSDVIDKYKDNPLLQSTPKSQMNYLYLSSVNGDNPVLRNKNFRAAIAHSIDKQVLVDNILKDGSKVADYFVAKDILYEAGQDFRSFSKTFEQPMFSVEKAQQYLKAAKTELKHETVTFDLEMYDLGRTRQIYENVKAQIEQNLPGVHVNLIMNPTQTYFQKLYEYHTPAAASQWQPDYLDVSNYFLPFTSQASQNFAQWKHERYDALYTQANGATMAGNPTERWNLYKEAEQILIDDYTIIPLYQSGSSYLQRENVIGYYESPGLPNVVYKYVSKSDESN